jgi:hypothetical protein
VHSFAQRNGLMPRPYFSSVYLFSYFSIMAQHSTAYVRVDPLHHT